MEKNNVLNIFSNIRHRLRATARNIAGEDNADDILQDAFCKLWTMHNVPSDIEQTEKITATIVRNISIDYWREKNNKEYAEVSSADDSKEQEIREIFEQVKRIVHLRLNENQRKILWMRDYEGFSFQEISEEMNLSEENVRKIISRARKIVRETYKSIN